MRKLVFALVAAFGLGTFASVAHAGGGCSYGHSGLKTTSTTPIQSPVETTSTTTSTDSTQTPG